MNKAQINIKGSNSQAIVKTSMNRGVALLSTILFATIMSITSLAIVKVYLINTDTIIRETNDIQADLLHKAAQSYAVFDLVKARKEVVSAGIPNQRLMYNNGQVPVTVSIQNESAFIDLIQTPATILNEVFEALSLDTSLITLLSAAQATQSLDNSFLGSSFSDDHFSDDSLLEGEFGNKGFSDTATDSPRTMRWLRQIYSNDPNMFEKFLNHTTFYNGSAQINQDIASEQLLRALPELNSSRVTAIIDAREKENKPILTEPISHPLLSNRASSYYRITTQMTINGQTSVKTHIIKINLNHKDVFEVIAQL